MSNGSKKDLEELRKYRPLLLAMEAVGWLHMAGKAKADFLLEHCGDKKGYNEKEWHKYENPPFDWDGFLGWVKRKYNNNIAWPSSLADFTEKHAERNTGLLGLLQAGHGIVSGIEKNIPNDTSKYLGQRVPHVWLSSPFGHPKRNLLENPPCILKPEGWQMLVGEMRRVLEELEQLGSKNVGDISHWWAWREGAIGQESYIRKAFLSTVAETRLPNNDVTLWDQSYVAAALFKSAVAGALLDTDFPWEWMEIAQLLGISLKNKKGQLKTYDNLGDDKKRIDEFLKSTTQWRALTVAIGSEHYEARAVKTGDWAGAQMAIREFFEKVRRLIEVDLAVGSLLYQDGQVALFSFPGEMLPKNNNQNDPWQKKQEAWLQEEIDNIARELDLETPPFVSLSKSTRSLISMLQERDQALKNISVPLHRKWDVRWMVPSEAQGHICPVCRVRLNGSNSRDQVCRVCHERREKRLRAWLDGKTEHQSIWFEEVADSNGRIGLITMSLDLEAWLTGERLDSLRAQSIPEWARFNPKLKNKDNPVKPDDLMSVMQNEIKKRFYDKNGQIKFDENDHLLSSLHFGYSPTKKLNPKKGKNEGDQEYIRRLWGIFFHLIVEDRAKAPSWDERKPDLMAAWLTHQLFVKLASPGRLYRFWRETQGFFEELLSEFRQMCTKSDNPWRTRRLLIKLENGQNNQYKDRSLYDGTLEGAPFSLVYDEASGAFITVSSLARVLKAHESKDVLIGKEIYGFREADRASGNDKDNKVKISKVEEAKGHLETYTPIIPLEVSPKRFRVLVPLEVASGCVDLAFSRWEEEFSRVWDRLPLRVGLIAFPRNLAFQGVMEAVRNLEHSLGKQETQGESWTVEDRETRYDFTILQMKRGDGRTTIRIVPKTMPDGRKDVFYPYVKVKEGTLRYPRDFRHPNGDIYRHMDDLRKGDGVEVAPARVSTLFMGSTGARFEALEIRYLEDWREMRRVWDLLERTAPSTAALQGLWAELQRLQRQWREGPTEHVDEELWQKTLRALLTKQLQVQAPELEVLTQAGLEGTLLWALQWHMKALKQGTKGE